ncbi:dihydrolipoyllysine-residue acetyltransferase [Cobetia sp. 2AS1]|uniref:dihydrolipoyllysine-residue acetyltransferase n=1 Tax=Cobetia sp. 2AS TaxID=3040017 RepID=UPI00178CBB36|nr:MULTISPECIES: dihydrolipoyllysine-residue acetyltransferase [unclassified Cobetia]MBE2169027.1 dihydrolipoyllysine-residue acetyltransferase [Cobetia sp. 2AS1]MDH2448861.1 dihydrolipoyllysine-residue acetyltransferase [Cobetia sp. 2AS]
MKDFILPDIGEGIVECELVKWLIKEGDVIEEDQPVAEVMTDKALVEIPAPHAGTVVKLYCQEGEIARVHAPLFAVDDGVRSDSDSDKTRHGEREDDPAGDVMTVAAPARSTAQAKSAASQAASSQSDVALSGSNEAPATPTAAALERRSRDFILPDIGEGIVECEVVTWHVAEGDTVEEDQTIVDVMTDKALVEITASEPGRIVRFHYAQGENARVHTPLYAYVPDEEAEAESAESTESGVTAPERKQAQPEYLSENRQEGDGKSDNRSGQDGRHGESRPRIPATPAVRRLLREHQLDIQAIAGSGRNGRVLKEDVLAYLKQSETRETDVTPDDAHKVGAAAETDKAAAEACAVASDVVSDEVRSSRLEAKAVPLKGVAAVMARRMVQASTQIPHFHYGDELDITDLLALRARLKVRAEQQGIRLTLMPFIMKAMALAVIEEPILNARLSEDESEILYQGACNIGMAVDSASGLMVPNVKGVERLSILEIAREVGRLTEAARSGRVAPADLKGGTLSISNIGALGGTYAAPIINQPEVAIVALGRTQRLPRFDGEGNVCARDIMTITWAGDHRIIDGGTIARFSNLWKHYLEHPDEMLLSLS